MEESQRLGKYIIREKIGEGGFGTVYQAQDPTLERIVALKVLKPILLADPVFVERFQREAKAAAALEHPNIVTIYEIGQDQGMHFLAMRYLGTDSLADLIARQGALSLGRAINLARQIAEALDYAHAHGMVHRDVKPSNILVGAGDTATLTDFGLVRSIEGSVLSSSQQMVGTVEYMAPEQLDTDRATEIGARTDLYAFGVLVYQMLTGRVPFAGSPTAVMAAHLFKDPPRPSQFRSDLPPALEAPLLKMLAKQPSERFETGQAFVNALMRARETKTPLPQPIAPAAEPPAKSSVVGSPANESATPSSPPPASPLPSSPRLPSPGMKKSLPFKTCGVLVLLTGCVFLGMLGLFNGLTNSGRAALVGSAKPTLVLNGASPYNWASGNLISGASATAKLNAAKRARVLNVSAEIHNLSATTLHVWLAPDCQTWNLDGSLALNAASSYYRTVQIPMTRAEYVNGTFCVSMQATLGSSTYLASNSAGQYLVKVTLSEE